MTSVTKPKRDWKRILPGILISALSLVILFYFIDIQRLIAVLQKADFLIIFLFVFSTLIWLLIRSKVWRTLLQEKATLSQVFFTLNEGYLLNNILPFRLGEVARAFLMSRKAGLKFFEVLSTIIVERSLDITFAVGMLLISLPFAIGASWAKQASFAASLMIVVVLAVLYVLARNQEWAIGMFERITRRWPSAQSKISPQLSAFFTGLAVFREGKRFLRTILWMTLNWLLSIGQYYLLIRAFTPAVKLHWIPFTLGAVSLGAAAPSSPGAVGVLELSMVGALAVFGLDGAIALAAALTAHLFSYLITGVIGIFALARDGLTLSGLYKNLQNSSTDTSA